MTTQDKIDSPRFGEIAFSSEDVVTFEDGLIGFPDLRSFVFLSHKPESPFRWMQSIEAPGLAFLVTDPTHYVPQYAPSITDRDANALGLSEESPMLVYTIVTIPKGKPEEMTLNLAGPVVIHADSRRARQIVLDDPAYDVRFRAFSAATQVATVAA